MADSKKKKKYIKMEHVEQYKRKWPIINIISSLYLQWKGIDCRSLQYERSVYKNFYTTSQANSNSSVLTGSLLDLWNIDCIYLYFLVKSPIFRMLFRNSPAFTSALISSRCNIIFTCTRSIYSPKIFKEGKFWEVDF